MSEADYQFSPLTLGGLGLVRRWLAAPHVARWWGDSERALAAIAGHLDDPGIDPYLVVFGGEPLGYLQVYDPFAEDNHPYRDQPRGCRGIDQFIGTVAMTGRGHGPAMLDAMAGRLFAEGSPRVLIDPDPDNHPAIRAYRKAGFRVLDARRSIATDSGPVPVTLMGRDNGTER